MKRASIYVVKVGGSLLDLPDLADRLRHWLSMQQPAYYVLIAGGGSLVDQVRAWHTSHPLDEVVAHRMCVDLMAVTARLLHARLPEIPLVEDASLMQEHAVKAGCAIFDSAGWMRRHEPDLPGTRLPSNWEVTGDAIAGRLAVAVGAKELVLMKSTLPKAATPLTINVLATMDYVDPMLSRLALEIPPLRLVNMRSDPPQEVRNTEPC